MKNKKKIIKKFILCAVPISGVIAFTAYNEHLDNQLEKIEFETEKTEEIYDYYNDSIIITLNDSQGINLNPGFWKNSYPEYLEEALNIEVIDASSLRYNKTSHVDMLLNNNLTIEEWKQLNNEGTRVAIQTLAEQMNIPTNFLKNMLGEIGTDILGQKIEDEDKNRYISDLLAECDNPIVVYSSGSNDIMYIAHATPISAKKYDKDGNITPKYLYAKSILEDSENIDGIIANIENNFQNIRSINPNTTIVALSIYTPKSLQSEEYQVFIEAINQYNDQLKELCQKYNAIYIDETELGKVYNQSSFNFHIDEIGHKQLASVIIDEIYDSLTNINQNDTYLQEYSYDTFGLTGFYNDLNDEILKVEQPTSEDINNNPYLLQVYEEQLNEKTIDANACQQLIKK